MIEQHIQPQPVNTACRLRVFWVRHRDIFFFTRHWRPNLVEFPQIKHSPSNIVFLFFCSMFQRGYCAACEVGATFTSRQKKQTTGHCCDASDSTICDYFLLFTTLWNGMILGSDYTTVRPFEGLVRAVPLAQCQLGQAPDHPRPLSDKAVENGWMDDMKAALLHILKIPFCLSNLHKTPQRECLKPSPCP